MNSKRTLAILPLLGALAVPTLAHASGLGNLTYTDQEVFKPIANFGGEGAMKCSSGSSDRRADHSTIPSSNAQRSQQGSP